MCPLELKRRYHDGRVIPFIGAGVSMSVQWTDPSSQTLHHGPSWKELVDEAARQLAFEDPKLLRSRGTDFQILEYFKLKHNDQIAKITNWLTRSMNPSNEALLDSLILRALAALDKCNVFYTTNYDNFIERALRLYRRDCRVIAVESQMGARDSRCEVVKFHGDLDHPDQIVLSESDYERRLSLSTAMDYRLRSDLLGGVLLFLGYSFRDPNVSYLFRLFTADYDGKPGSLSGPRAFILVPNPSDFELRLFRARRIEVIPIDELNLTRDTANLLNEMRS